MDKRVHLLSLKVAEVPANVKSLLVKNYTLLKANVKCLNVGVNVLKWAAAINLTLGICSIFLLDFMGGYNEENLKGYFFLWTIDPRLTAFLIETEEVADGSLEDTYFYEINFNLYRNLYYLYFYNCDKIIPRGKNI